MTEKLKQTIQEEIMKLPNEMQEAINVFDWASVAEQIGKKYLLSESQINDFQAETSLVLIGIEDEYSYAFNIKNNVGIEMNEAEKMADEAFGKILEPIKDIMEENIKKNLKNKNITTTQNLNFILSGGDYSVFIEEKSNTTSSPEKTDKLIGTSNILETKDRLLN